MILQSSHNHLVTLVHTETACFYKLNAYKLPQLGPVLKIQSDA